MSFKSGLQIRSGAIIVMAIASAALAGCASTYNSGIQERGPDTYFLSIRLPSVEGGSTEAKRQALAEADDYCDRKTGNRATLTSEELGPVTADIYFTCSESSDM
jgi:hypothetical protein